MKWENISNEVYGTDADIVNINLNDIQFLKHQINACQNNRIRICAHQQANDLLHEMLIVIAKGSYIRPHKHLNKSESFHMIEGMLDIIIFNDEGSIIETIQMGDAASGKSFFYRLSAPYFHTLILRTDLVVFHETTNGPFLKEKTIYAEWAPDNSDFLSQQKFIQNLEAKIITHQIGK